MAKKLVREELLQEVFGDRMDMEVKVLGDKTITLHHPSSLECATLVRSFEVARSEMEGLMYMLGTACDECRDENMQFDYVLANYILNNCSDTEYEELKRRLYKLFGYANILKLQDEFKAGMEKQAKAKAEAEEAVEKELEKGEVDKKK